MSIEGKSSHNLFKVSVKKRIFDVTEVSGNKTPFFEANNPNNFHNIIILYCHNV